MTDRDYAIKSLKEVTVKLARKTEDAMDCHYKKMKELLECYQELVLENQMVLAELEQECQEKLNEDMAYALQYMSVYDYRLDVVKLRREMNNLMMIYSLSDMVYRALVLMKYYAPKGPELSEIIHNCFCSNMQKTDIEVQIELGYAKTKFYAMKKRAVRYMGFYFYEVVLPQAKGKRFKPSFDMSEE